MSQHEPIFHPWVRRKLHLSLMILFLMPVSFTGGIVNLANVYMVGTSSAIPADITMAFYTHMIGFALGIPILGSVRGAFSYKAVLAACLITLVLCNGAIAVTDQPLVYVMASFV